MVKGNKLIGVHELLERFSKDITTGLPEHVLVIAQLLEDLKYFSYLVVEHEISDDKILAYYIPKLKYWFGMIEKMHSMIKEVITQPVEAEVDDIIANSLHRLDNILNDLKLYKIGLKPWLDKYPTLTADQIGKVLEQLDRRKGEREEGENRQDKNPEK